MGGSSSQVADTQSAYDTHGTMLNDIVTARKDCIAFVSPRRGVVGVTNSTTATDNVINDADTLPSSSYLVFDSGYKYMYDKYNDTYRFVPLNGDIAGTCARTDQVADAFFYLLVITEEEFVVQSNLHTIQINLKEIDFTGQE